MKFMLAATVLLIGVLLFILAVSPATGEICYPFVPFAPTAGVAQAAEVAAVPVGPGPGEHISFSMRGFNYPSWDKDGYRSQASSRSLDQIAATGANWVAICPTQYMENASAVNIGPDPGGRTSTDEAVARAIDDAHARGFKVMLKPHVDLLDDTWRGDIHPVDVSAWFSAYGEMILHYARLAAEHQVELLVVGTEFASLSGPEHYLDWAEIIAAVHLAYPGPLTYAASQNEYLSVAFWQLLDYLGINVYFPLSDLEQPSSEELMAGWTAYDGSYGRFNWLAALEQWQSRWGKPVIFTELGYRSVKYAARAPWDYTFAGEFDGLVQSRAADAAIKVFNNKPWLAGIFWWNWTAGDDGSDAANTDYTVLGKPAEATLTAWYSSATPRLKIDLQSIAWASYADYQAQRLRVVLLLQNQGNDTAYDARINSITASSGVTAEGSSLMGLGNLEPGATQKLQIIYKIPAGVTSFKTVVSLSYIDRGGIFHLYH